MPILAQEKLPITEDETAPEVLKRLSIVGAEALTDTIKKYAQGILRPSDQAHHEATFTKIFSREDGQINFNLATNEVWNLWRALIPWPGLYALDPEGRHIKFLKLKKTTATLNASAGTLLSDDKKLFLVLKDGALEVLELQLEGKKAVTASAFINGHEKSLPMILK